MHKTIHRSIKNKEDRNIEVSFILTGTVQQPQERRYTMFNKTRKYYSLALQTEFKKKQAVESSVVRKVVYI